MGNLILVRHGESRWNVANKFTGWVDVPLTDIGILEAQVAAEKLRKYSFDVAFCSRLERAQATLLIILSSQKRTGVFFHDDWENKEWQKRSNFTETNEIPIYSHEALNERYYGALQGLQKDQAKETYGEQQVFAWRRSFLEVPPEGESLEQAYKRIIPYFRSQVMKEVKKGKNVIVAAHSNTLRAIIKYVEQISHEDIPLLDLPTAEPVIFSYTKEGLKKLGKPFTFDRPIYWSS